MRDISCLFISIGASLLFWLLLLLWGILCKAETRRAVIGFLARRPIVARRWPGITIRGGHQIGHRIEITAANNFQILESLWRVVWGTAGIFLKIARRPLPGIARHVKQTERTCAFRKLSYIDQALLLILVRLRVRQVGGPFRAPGIDAPVSPPRGELPFLLGRQTLAVAHPLGVSLRVFPRYVGYGHFVRIHREMIALPHRRGRVTLRVNEFLILLVGDLREINEEGGDSYQVGRLLIILDVIAITP